MNIIPFIEQKNYFYKRDDVFYGTLFFIFFISIFTPFAFSFKFFDPYTTVKWGITLATINIIFFLFLYRSPHLIVPKIPKALLFIICLIFLFIFINSYIHNVPLISYENIRRFTFWGAVVFFLNFFFTQKEKGFNEIENVICFSSAVFVIPALIQYILYPGTPAYLTFGNINLSAEYVGFSFVFQLGLLVRLWINSQQSIFINVLSSLSLSYIYFTNCRSIYIAITLIFISLFIFYKRVWKKAIPLLMLSLLSIFLIKIILLISQSESLSIEKSLSVRWLLYLDTLTMIMENPLGVGVGQYEFASIPYMGNLFPEFNEHTLFLSPHNEFLHYLSEDGLILSFLFLLLSCVFVYYFWEAIKSKFISYPEFLFFTIIMFIQSLFQFPLIDPIPYFMTAIIVGYFFSTIKIEYVAYPLASGLKIILLIANFLSFIVIIIYFSSNYIAFNFPENEKINNFVCSFGNRNWFSCLNVASSRIAEGDYNTAAFYASRTLHWQPLNYEGIKALGFSLLYQQENSKACKEFAKYDSFFENQSSVHELFTKECWNYPQQ